MRGERVAMSSGAKIVSKRSAVAAMRNVVVLSLLLMAFTSCVRRPLYDPVDVHYIRVYLDEDLQNMTTGFYREDANKGLTYNTPEKMKVVMYDPSSGEEVASRFLQRMGSDQRGNYFEGYVQCPAGDYLLIARSFGSDVTLVANESNYFNAVASTTPMSMSIASNLPRKSDSDTARMNIPDHLFVASSNVSLKHSREVDTLWNEQHDFFTAESVVDTYYMQIKVKGLQYLSSVYSMLRGLSGVARLHDGKKIDVPVEIAFEMNYADMMADEATMYASFNTFGKVTGRKYKEGIVLQFVVVTLDGKAHTTSIDIAPEFEKADALNHKWILLNMQISIPEPSGGSGDGGFKPGVTEWNEVVIDIEI